MNRTELVQAVIWLDQIAAAAKVEAAKLRADLAADARAELDEQGTAPTWRIPDVATVAASVTHETATVWDEKEFATWVAQRYPTEVETVTRIRQSWLTDFLTKGVVGVPSETGSEPVDAATGEFVPGLHMRPGGDFAGISIRPSTAARQVYAAVATKALRELAQSAGPAVPVVLAELEAADAQP